MIKWLLVGLVIAAALLLWRVSAYSKRREPKAGEPAPDFSLPDQDGRNRSLSEFRGKWLVLYFYPKDDTPGCTRQACAFRDGRNQLAALGAQVVGVSVDDVESHLDFAKEHRLPFPLLADAGGAVAARYGSLRDLGLIKFARRNTFLIDPQGCIAMVYLSASPAGNAQEVVEDLNRLRGK